MSGVIHTVPMQPHEAGSASHDIKQAKELAQAMNSAYAGEEFKAPIPNAKLVDELCKFLGREYTEEFERQRKADWVNPEDRPTLLPQVKFNDEGINRTAVSKADFERTISPWKYPLGELMESYPRERGESIADYRTRLCQSSADPWGARMTRMAICAAHIQRIETEEFNERTRIAEEARQAERERREQLEKRASPDEGEVKSLLGIVEGAAESEQFLDQIMTALNVHRAADYAREKLRSIFDEERSACAQLGKRAKSRPDIPGTTLGAYEFAQMVKRANAAQPRIAR
jgi:hypothetical protein